MDRTANASPPPALHLGENIAHRACAHCRSQKVRCLPDDHNPDICQRCARSGRPCVFTPLQKRRQRKRTDTRVAELEREMRMMRALLKEKNEGHENEDAKLNKTSPPGDGSHSISTHDVAPRKNSTQAESHKTDSLFRHYNASQAQIPSIQIGESATHQMLLTAHQEPDVIDKGVLSMELASGLFEMYRNEYFPLYPMVAIPPSMTAQDLRTSRPILFLAVLTVAADRDDPDLSTRLDQELVVTLASRSLVRAQKSLELVQALLLSVIWYHPPQHTGQMKYYEYAHMAATMAFDIGIGTRPIPHKSLASRKSTAAQAMLHSLTTASASSDAWATQRTMGSEAQSDSIECRRTFVSCYIICTIVALSLRRPNMLRISNYIKECLDYLENAPDAIASDFILAAWGRLCMIGEELSVAFALDDPDNIASIADLRCQIMLKAFERRLTTWQENITDAHSHPCLMAMYYQVRLLAFELALYVEFSPEDFKAPYEIGVVHESDDDVPSQLLAEAVAECIAAAHGTCSAIMACAPNTVRAIPGFTYIRVCFGAFILTKLNLSASHPRSRIGSVLDRSSLKAEQTLDKLIMHLRQMIGNTRPRVLAIMLALLFKMREWVLYPEQLMGGAKDSLNPLGKTLASQISFRPGQSHEPRIVEHVSSTDSSPHSHQDRNSSTAGSAGARSPASVNHMVTPPATYQRLSAANVHQVSMGPPPVPVSYTLQSHPTMPYVPQSTDMPMPDPDLMQLWEDVSRGLPEGSLSGLEDWTGMSFGPAPDGWGFSSFGAGFGRQPGS